jgi:hypothetical protein
VKRTLSNFRQLRYSTAEIAAPLSYANAYTYEVHLLFKVWHQPCIIQGVKKHDADAPLTQTRFEEINLYQG